MALSATKVNALLKAGKPGKWSDGDNLYLQISKFGTGSWLFRFTLNGKAHWHGLGSTKTFALAEARQRARAARQQLADGDSPIELRRAKREAAMLASATAVTFKDAAERFIAAHKASWRSARHRAQWQETLGAYCYPVIGSLPVAGIDTNLVLKVLEPIWGVKPETASRVRGRIEKVLDWAKARKLRSGENPAAWRGHLENILPAPKKLKQPDSHHAAMSYVELPGFMEKLRAREGIRARALEFCILTAARTSEVRLARWSEIDLDAATWTIPAERMKSGKEHKVPLSDRAVAMLKALPRIVGTDFLFPGQRPGKPLGDVAMWKLLKDMGIAGATTHGFRSSFRDWAAECTSTPEHVAEMALAHTVSDAVVRAYRRTNLFDKRRDLMAAWASYCEALPASVTPLRRVQS